MSNLPSNEVIDQIVAGAVQEQATKAPGLRQVHAKSHGCVWGEFIIADDIPESLRIGVFSKVKTYPIWARFSNGSSPLSQGELQSDKIPDVRGFAIKLMQVEGKKILEDEPSTQDFVMINHAIFFARNAQDYIRLAEVSAGKLSPESMAYELGILEQMRAKKVLNPLLIQYWSATPYRLGRQVIRYSAKPQVLDTADSPIPDSDNYLREALKNSLTSKQQDSYFDFLIQLQPDDDPKWVDDPTLPWDETICPYIKVATVKIPSQEFDTLERKQFDEGLSFTPWHTLPEHEPLGSVNAPRLKVYQTIAKNRREHNHQATTEPQPFFNPTCQNR
ncbi:MAG: catalase family protein [Calothrix sp. C42_A2020_038]|nr:catalase family protein [Calothrix sp. C42_A2020_038]